MKVENICLGCMEDKGEQKVCPKCGWAEGTGPESPLHLKPGTILSGKYMLGKVLGHGGFGITYIAYELNLGLKLAIKEYFPQGMATRTTENSTISVFTGELRTQFEFGLEKFLDEARTLAKFHDVSGIIAVRDFFRENGTAYLVMNYLEGITMKEYLTRNGERLPYEMVLNIMMPVMDALEHVHQAGILHRDISPDNIYITANLNVKLLDFGAARFAMGEQSRSLSVILKPGYAPEEQYRSKGKQGPWTDVYATAATMYRALTGQNPPEALDRLDGDTLVPPSRLGAGIPPQAEGALLKALAVRHEERFKNIAEFQNALISGIDVQKPVAPPITGRPSSIERPASTEGPSGGYREVPPPPAAVSSNPMPGYVKAIIGIAAAVCIIVVTFAIAQMGTHKTKEPSHPSAVAADSANATPASSNTAETPAKSEPAPTAQGGAVAVNGKQIDTGKISGIIDSDAHGASYSVYIRDLKTNDTYFTSNKSEARPAGGVVYVPIMIAAFEEANSGELSLDSTVTVDRSMLVGGTGIIASKNATGQYKIRDLITIMMQHSDNTAANALIDSMGGFQAINSSLSRLGATKTVINRKLMDTNAISRGIDNYTSAEDMGKILELMAAGKLISPEYSQQMVNLMKKQEKQGIPQYLPAGIEVAHQTGLLDKVFNDVGIVYGNDSAFIVSVFSKGSTSDYAADIVGKIANSIYEDLQ